MMFTSTSGSLTSTSEVHVDVWGLRRRLGLSRRRLRSTSVLATLTFLSYAKLLHTIIAAMSVTYLDYPNGSTVAVWLYDGNVRYLREKHIPLFVTAIAFFVLLLFPYTLHACMFILLHKETYLYSFC